MQASRSCGIVFSMKPTREDRALLKKSQWLAEMQAVDREHPNTDEIRWRLGEQILATGYYVPGIFVFVYGAVIGWKHLARAIGRLGSSGFRAVAPRLALPRRMLALPPPCDAAPRPQDN